MGVRAHTYTHTSSSNSFITNHPPNAPLYHTLPDMVPTGPVIQNMTSIIAAHSTKPTIESRAALNHAALNHTPL